MEKMLEEQKKVKKSQLVYRDFLERNGLINEDQEKKIKKMKKKRKEKKKKEEKSRPINKFC